MTDKKFTLEYENEEICQIYENDNCMSVEDVVDLLNELYEENQKLTKINMDMDRDKKLYQSAYNEVYDENSFLFDEIMKMANKGVEVSDEFRKYLADQYEFEHIGCGVYDESGETVQWDWR